MAAQGGLSVCVLTGPGTGKPALSDRMAAMNGGKIGTSQTFMNARRTAFVADFIGASNFLKGEVVSAADGSATIKLQAARHSRCGLSRRETGSSG